MSTSFQKNIYFSFCVCYNLLRKCVENMNNYNNIGLLIKSARKEKGYSARELAKLCDISHTEISNIEKGERVKPAILTLKAFEKYLDLDFKKLAKAVGYAPETIEFGDNNIIVSYERYDKRIREYEYKMKEINDKLIVKNHLVLEMEKFYTEVFNYLKSQDSVDKKIMMEAEKIFDFIKGMKD